MVDENKIRVCAPIEVEHEVEKAAIEKASVLAFPDEKQSDLQYIRSCLVSAGTNKNGAHFLPSEMVKAHNTVVHKAIDIEHEEDKVIGHIYECAYMYKDGTQFDPLKVRADYEEACRDLDELDMDIGVAGVIHKMRFPGYADEISSGDWKVSMECFFKDFDIKIGDTIITRDEAQALGYDCNELIGGFVKVVAGHRELGTRMVARVLRHITFSGMGIVKNPANPHSIIMETAAHKELLEKGEQTIDLERIDNLRGHKVILSEKTEAASVGKEVDVSDSLVEVSSVDSDDETPKLFLELDEGTGGVSRVITVSPNKEVAARWSGGGLPGPGRVASNVDSTCASFKKRLTKYNALDQSEGAVIQEHYCALFEERCPVIGATAKAPECLRNQKNSVTKDPGDTTITKTIREHLDVTPGNTFTTVLGKPAMAKDTAATEPLSVRQDQISRLREEAQSLRNSLKDFDFADGKKNS
jgi:hypothetical protein